MCANVRCDQSKGKVNFHTFIVQRPLSNKITTSHTISSIVKIVTTINSNRTTLFLTLLTTRMHAHNQSLSALTRRHAPCEGCCPIIRHKPDSILFLLVECAWSMMPMIDWILIERNNLFHDIFRCTCLNRKDIIWIKNIFDGTFQDGKWVWKSSRFIGPI